jgi:hypothetical protein
VIFNVKAKVRLRKTSRTPKARSFGHINSPIVEVCNFDALDLPIPLYLGYRNDVIFNVKAKERL